MKILVNYLILVLQNGQTITANVQNDKVQKNPLQNTMPEFHACVFK